MDRPYMVSLRPREIGEHGNVVDTWISILPMRFRSVVGTKSAALKWLQDAHGDEAANYAEIVHHDATQPNKHYAVDATLTMIDRDPTA
jgi:hypothetical protein